MAQWTLTPRKQLPLSPTKRPQPTTDCQTLQTELLAIQKALKHAETRNKPVVIHTDSMGAIQALSKGMPKDNFGLITTILATAGHIQEGDRTIHINWIPSHAGIPGNEEADTAAKNALLLPNITAQLPPSLSSLKNNIRATTSQAVKGLLQKEANKGSPSANWYLRTAGNTNPFPSNPARKTRTSLHRLRLGFKCLNELKDSQETCKYCNTVCGAPLLHYLEECEQTRQHLDRSLGTHPDIIKNTPHTTLAELIRTFPPPR